MHFYEIFLGQPPQIFTWHSREKLRIGDRISVDFRGRKKIGIVLAKSENPDFPTREIESVLDLNFVNETFISLAQKLSRDHFCPLGKILNLMIPAKFFSQKDPVLRQKLFRIVDKTQKLNGEKQKKIVEILTERGTWVDEKVLLEAKISKITIKNLVQKKIIEHKNDSILAPKIKIDFSLKKRQKKDLNAEQSAAFSSILGTQKPVLLFGITGSGKTEIYKKMAEKTSGQILILVPEIMLTPQLIADFAEIFPDQKSPPIAVWHSKLSEGEKVQNWARIQSGSAKILIGARSAVMVPIPNLELIIVDEEHEWTFKNEFAPRFWAHEVVEFLAEKMGAKLIFGSATPRLESFEKAERKIYQRVDLKTRVFRTPLPEIEIVDFKNEIKKGNFSPISERLESEISSLLERGKQGVLFLNKRGLFGTTWCQMCGHYFECKNCSTNLKLHTKFDQKKLLCHFCGHLEFFPSKCPKCAAENFDFRGWGTQMVEKIIAEKFPSARVLRADADSVRGKNDFENLRQKFLEKKADLLLGTQMVAKGLDFENVELAGVILADVGLGVPDFRAEERVFQILTQVAGRAGRRSRRGKIVIQTFRPNEKIFDFVQNHDAENFLKWQQIVRKKAKMPPFSAFGKITFSDPKKEMAFARAQNFFQFAQKNFAGTVHFAPAFFPKIFGKFHFHVFLHTENIAEIRTFLAPLHFGPRVKIDLNPSSLL